MRTATALYLVALGLGDLFSGGRYRAFVPATAILLLVLAVTLWDSFTQLCALSGGFHKGN